MRTIWKIATLWGLGGFGIALLFFILFASADRYSQSQFLDSISRLGQDIVLFVWPTSFWLMATEGAGRVATAGVVSIAVISNFLVYFLVGLGMTSAWRALRWVGGWLGH